MGEDLIPVTPISMATDQSSIYTALRQYKWVHRPHLARRQCIRLAGLLSGFMSMHRDCFAPDGWDIATAVPSLSGRQGPHPLGAVLKMAWPSHLYYSRVLDPMVDKWPTTPAPGVMPATVPVPAKNENQTSCSDFACDPHVVRGLRILLVDDTLTTGAHIQSAAIALLRSGAAEVLPLVIGRRLTPGRMTTSRTLRWARLPENRWSLENCLHCRAGERPSLNLLTS